MMKPVLFLSLSTAVVWSTATMSLAFSPTSSTFSSTGTRAFGSISSIAKVPAHRDWHRSALRLSLSNGNSDAGKDNQKSTFSRISPYLATDWPFLAGLSLLAFRSLDCPS
jgi:hypothetical protein